MNEFGEIRSASQYIDNDIYQNPQNSTLKSSNSIDLVT